ncbi:MAG: patatin-like phospholipase family protein [Deltaproteobacteria bacterium]|nr:patatin-like phospholipase family protein [Deltaproteobacteria bacterium]
MKTKWIGNDIGLALGGGGARGLAHIGVLKVLEEEQIPISLIAGTSSGALIGAAYASGVSAAELETKVTDYLNSEEFQSSAIRSLEQTSDHMEVGLTKKIHNFFLNKFYLAQAMFKPGILSAEEFQLMIEYFVPDILIQDTLIPFHAVATDLVSAEKIIFSEGPLRFAVSASCSVPGAVEPLRHGQQILSDGGIVTMVPAGVARCKGADTVIAVVVDKMPIMKDELRSAFDVFSRANDVMSRHLVAHDLMDADIIIRPEVGHLQWADFSQALGLVDAGAKATKEALPKIRRAISGINKWFPVKKIMRTVLQG